MKRTILALSTLIFVTSASYGADTTETFPRGLSGVISGIAGSGIDQDEKSYSFTNILAAGLVKNLNLWFIWSATGDQDLHQTGESTGLKLLYTAMDSKHLDLDASFDVSASGGALTLTPGLEINLDRANKLKAWGVYAKVGLGLSEPAAPAEGAEADDSLTKTLNLTPGAYYTLKPSSQVLFEYSQALELGESPEDMGRFALGFNQRVKGVELLAEVGYREDGIDASLFFIAVLPTGR